MEIQGFHLLWHSFPRNLHKFNRISITNFPGPASRRDGTGHHNMRIRPSSRSLATTNEISVDFFSLSYLDVSLHSVIS